MTSSKRWLAIGGALLAALGGSGCGGSGLSPGGDDLSAAIDLRASLPADLSPSDVAMDAAAEVVDLAISDLAWTSRWADGCAIGAKGKGFSFAPSVKPAVPGPGQVIAFDFNRDGRIDLAVPGGLNHDQVYVFLGKGDGTFGAATLYPVPTWFELSRPQPLALGDFNNDGAMDLLVSGASKPYLVSVLLGVGDGTFRKAITSPIGSGNNCDGSGLNTLAAGQLSGDSFLDVLVVGACSQILYGDGKGGLSPAPLPMPGISFGNLFYPWWLAAALGDVDRDGVPDLWVCDGWNNNKQYYERGSTDGGFGSPTQIPGVCTVAAFRDFNRDGRLDVVWGEGALLVQLGNGDGTFQPSSGLVPRERVPYEIYGLDTGGGITTADLDGDGILDLFGVGFGKVGPTDYLVVCRGNGDGTFLLPDATPIDPGGGWWTTAAGDFDGDCRPDLVVSDRMLNHLQIFLNTTP